MNAIRTSNFIRAEKFIKEAVTDNRIAVIIGEKGSGKTFIKRQIIGGFEERQGLYRVVDITPMSENVRNINQIIGAIISDVSGDSPRRDGESRRRQLRRTLGDSSHQIILAIDEAQDLHKSTLRGLKKIHEIGFGLRDRLFAIILFGQPSLKDKISDDELRPRFRKVQMKELTMKEKELFIENKNLFTEEALKLFIKRTRKTPLSIITAFEDLNQVRIDLDKKKIDEAIVNDYFSMDIRETILSSGKSFRRIASEIKDLTGESVSPTAINQHINGKYKGNTEKLDRLMVEYTEKINTPATGRKAAL